MLTCYYVRSERVELVSCIAEVDPTPAGGIVLTRDAVEQVYVREANLIKENAGGCSPWVPPTPSSGQRSY